jgi:uncharacterized protein
MIVVSDTSPITSLLTIDLINILEQMFHDVFIPEAVYNELQHEHDELPSFLHIGRVIDRNMVSKFERELDKGEAEAIVFALEKKADVLLIDEKKGRLIAEREGVPIIGLIGVLVAAKRKKIIKNVREVLDKLEQEAGFRVSQSLRNHILSIVGE